MVMASPSTIPPFAFARPHPVSEQERAHRRHLLTALNAGELVAETAPFQTGWFVRMPHSVLRALVTARQLTATQIRYLLCVLEYSYGFNHPDYAIADLRTRRVPTVADWSAWLGGMHPKQVLATRRALIERGIIRFVDDDPTKVAFNPSWETWDSGIFASHAAHPGVGRPRRYDAAPGVLPGDPVRPEDLRPDQSARTANLFLPAEQPEEVIPELLTRNSRITRPSQVVIQPFPQEARESRCQAVSGAPTKDNLIKEPQEEETPAAAGAARRAPADRAVSSPETAKARRTSPSPPLPERLAGETSRVYWTRAYLATEGEGTFRQRAVVHAAARAVLGLALTRADLVLLGQLCKAAGSWGTVLHWVLKTGDAAVVDVWAYLYGFIRQAGGSPPVAVPPGSARAENVTPAGTLGGMPPDNDLTPTPEDMDFLFELRLRAGGLWEQTTLDRVPPNEVQIRLLTLGALCERASWCLDEGVAQLRQALKFVTTAALPPAEVWPALIGELERRVQDAPIPPRLMAPQGTGEQRIYADVARRTLP